MSKVSVCINATLQSFNSRNTYTSSHLRTDCRTCCQ